MLSNRSALDSLAPFGEALAEPTRRRILAVLTRDGHSYPGDLAAELGVAPTALSHHLAWLRGAGLVAAGREGRRVRQELTSVDLRAALLDLSAGELGTAQPAPEVGALRHAPSRIPSSHPHHQPRDLSAQEREAFRQSAIISRRAKAAALAGEGPTPLHEINAPVLAPLDLMPQRAPVGLRSLSLFSGGGGLDLRFARAGLTHVASYELLQDAANTLQKAHPEWQVFGGQRDGDVNGVDWGQWRGEVDVLHGGPPCQPFSVAGRQRGHLDPRDGWPAFVRAGCDRQRSSRRTCLP